MSEQVPLTEEDFKSMSQVEILVKLHEGAIDFLRKGMAAMETGDTTESHRLIERGRLIIKEFKRTLDHQVSSGFSGQLDDLYDFMLDNLEKAEQTHGIAPIEHVVQLLTTLLEGWHKAQA